MASAAGYDAATGTSINPDFIALTSLVFVQVFFVTMVYGPIAAFLVELFPVQIRYTSMSLPDHNSGNYGHYWISIPKGSPWRNSLSFRLIER